MKHVPSHRDQLQFKYNNYLKQNTRGFSFKKKSITNVQFEMIKEYQKKKNRKFSGRPHNHTPVTTQDTG
jgi:hypothetical protein